MAYAGRKYRTLKDLRERTMLSKDSLRKIFKCMCKIKRPKWRISKFYLYAYWCEISGIPQSSEFGKPVCLETIS